MSELHLTYRAVGPDAYRTSFDGAEVGSVSKRTHHVQQRDHWHWGVDTMPLMDHGGRPSSGHVESFEAAMEAFKTAFTKWHSELSPGLWEENRTTYANELGTPHSPTCRRSDGRKLETLADCRALTSVPAARLVALLVPMSHPRTSHQSSQGWRTFLDNHAPDIAAMDLFVVPTIGFDLLYAFVIVRLDRRDLVWINVTTHPTAEWVVRQITEAFPWDEAPHYLIRDRDRIYGSVVTRRLRAMGIRDKPTAPASPWQNGFAERLIGSIRRECVDHFVVLGEAHLRRILGAYAGYYNDIRTHRSLDKDAPVSRPVQPTGIISSHAILGGLHHHYVRV